MELLRVLLICIFRLILCYSNCYFLQVLIVLDDILIYAICVNRHSLLLSLKEHQKVILHLN